MTRESVSPQSWPYPRWIAHRGAGKLAPENTIAAFNLGSSYGYRMFECDVKLSADDTPFLLHDSTLTRTTNQTALWGPTSSATGGDYPIESLLTLDAGAWHSEAFVGERLPTLDALAQWCFASQSLLNIEIKPTPGRGHLTGKVIANAVSRLWEAQPIPPLLTSFDVEALLSAKQAQPDLPLGLLLDTLPADWLDVAVDLGCIAVVCQHKLWNEENVAALKRQGLRALSYTVNTQTDVDRLLKLGTDGIITDRVDLFKPE